MGEKSSETRPLFAHLFSATLFYWASLPPVGAWPLAFVVPVFWCVLIRHPLSLKFRYVYTAAFVFWMASIWWIACPHPLTTIGLIALAAYLSVYLPMFLAASRVAVHRFRIPVIVAAPLCWVGCEFLRNHVLGGFSFCSLEHALYLKPKFLQLASIGGGYLVAAMIVAVGTGIGTLWPIAQEPGASAPGCVTSRWSIRGLTPPALGIVLLLVTAFYGSVRFAESNGLPTIRIAALQGNIPVTLLPTPDYVDKVFEQFRDLTFQAVAEKPAIIVWPETVCPINNFEFRSGAKPEDFGWTDEEIAENQAQFGRMAQAFDVPLLVGLSTLIFDDKRAPHPNPLPEGEGAIRQPKRLNSALYVGTKKIGPRYDKVRLVMFGEYIPFSSLLPDNFFLKTLCVEATSGREPVAIPVGDSWAAVNICFESSIPHWIREQVLTLKRQGTPPGLLINMSNDGWFWFSQQIDQHLATHVLRAIENGLPCITATNGGFSAIIDERGAIQKIGNRCEAEAVIGDVKPGYPDTPYQRIGDWPPFACSLLVFLLLTFSRRQSRAGNSDSPPVP